jgi:anaerobic magnesium-protoporphyrin IX monomethyl ester cyclase
VKGDKIMTDLDLLLINPSGRDKIYQQLGEDLTAIEPALWCRLIAGYVRDRGFSVRIIDAEAVGWSPEAVAHQVVSCQPKLVGMIVFGHQPSASTQQMAAAGPTCRSIKGLNPGQPIIIVGGHVAALPERTLRKEAVDFACNSEGPTTVYELLAVLRAGEPLDFTKVQGLVWWDNGVVRSNLSPPLIKELDQDLHGNVWDLLPMEKYRAAPQPVA